MGFLSQAGVKGFDCLNNGKRSIAVNLKEKEGVEVVKKLCAYSDVLIDPYRPGEKEF